MRGEFRLRSSRALKLAQSDKTIRRRHYRHRDRGSTRHAGVEEGPTLSTFEMPIPGLFLAIRPLGLVLGPFLLRSLPLPHCPGLDLRRDSRSGRHRYGNGLRFGGGGLGRCCLWIRDCCEGHQGNGCDIRFVNFHGLSISFVLRNCRAPTT